MQAVEMLDLAIDLSKVHPSYKERLSGLVDGRQTVERAITTLYEIALDALSEKNHRRVSKPLRAELATFMAHYVTQVQESREPRNLRMPLLVNRSDKDRWKAAAEALNMTTSEFVRMAADRLAAEVFESRAKAAA